jgi:hypothetical protein
MTTFSKGSPLVFIDAAKSLKKKWLSCAQDQEKILFRPSELGGKLEIVGTV